MLPDILTFPKLPPTASSLAASASAPKRQRLSTPSTPPNLSIPTTQPSTTMATTKMELVSPASPMGLRLTSDINKAATVFLSHVRRTFARHPVDYTGELVRLLDDIATFTCTASSAVTERSPELVYGSVGTGSEVNPQTAIRGLYRLLANDGYCCIILAKGHDQPMTFSDSVLHGNYVVCVSPLDMDPSGSDERGVAGMTFSVYKRKSSTSLPGRGMDLRQNLGDQVAAGYASFSSATTLYYTMGHGVYSFVMHPVALQYFLQPPIRHTIPENPTTVYSDRAMLKTSAPISKSLSSMVDKFQSSMYTTGCVVGDVHQLIQTGGVLVAANVHLMCEAAPLAFLVEQCEGVATDDHGQRILDMSITEDYNINITIVLGTKHTHASLNLKPKTGANGINGTSAH